MTLISELILQTLSIISTTLFSINATVLMHKLYSFIRVEMLYRNNHVHSNDQQL